MLLRRLSADADRVVLKFAREALLRSETSRLDLHQISRRFRGTRIPSLWLYRAGSQAIHQLTDAD